MATIYLDCKMKSFSMVYNILFSYMYDNIQFMQEMGYIIINSSWLWRLPSFSLHAIVINTSLPKVH